MRALPALLFLSAVSAAPVFGWGCEGHAIVALIARAHLTPAASAAVDQLLRENPIDPALKRFCQDRPADPMADVATWPDDVRVAERTGDWHFVDIPRSVTSGTKLDEWCPPVGQSTNAENRPGCVTNAIQYNAAIVRDPKAAPIDRAIALRYVIHFVGDMHQPLHVSDNHDRGGNCTSIRFFDEEKPTNLHAIWDYKVLQRAMAAKHASLTDYAAALDKQFASNWHAWGESGVNPQDWAWEGHKVAALNTYGALNPAIPVGKPQTVDTAGCNLERDKVTPLHIGVTEEYFNQAQPVIDQQLARAGYRLAALLNSTF